MAGRIRVFGRDKPDKIRARAIDNSNVAIIRFESTGILCEGARLCLLLTLLICSADYFLPCHLSLSLSLVTLCHIMSLSLYDKVTVINKRV